MRPLVPRQSSEEMLISEPFANARAGILTFRDHSEDLVNSKNSTAKALVPIHSITAAEQLEMTVDQHNTCCLCGTHLNFEHRVDHLTLLVKEVANCPTCLIRMREHEYKLQ